MPDASPDSPAPHAHDGAVGWLRLIGEEDAGGVRAALFETSGEGQPLAFCCTRIDRREPSVRRSEDPSGSARAQLMATLLRAADPSPAFVLGLDGELPPAVGDGRVPLPLCRVRPAGAPAGPSFEWTAEESAAASEARRLFDETVRGEDALEPFERAGRALAEAFDDERVHALGAAPGLSTVVSLRPPPERSASEEERLSDENGAAPGQAHGDLTLTARLWALLAAPSRALRYGHLEWPGEFMPFQREGIAALVQSDRLLLADDMGLGKTVQAAAAVRLLRSRNEIGSCLVVAPASLLGQWRRELDRWAPELSAIIVDGPAGERAWKWPAKTDVKLVSYETLRSDFGGGPHAPVRREQWGVVIADEAQRAKNRNDTSRALKGLRRARSWALTGTPIENHEEELASIIEFVDHDPSGEPKRYSPGAALRSRHGELQLRRKKSEVLDDLPPKQVTMVPIDLRPRQRRSYDKAEQEGVVYLKSLGAEVSVTHVFDLIGRLKQICNADPETGESSKLDDITERIAELADQGHKALVFSQYVGGTAGVAAAVDRLREFAPLSITGETPPQERAAVVERFQAGGGHKVLVLSLRAGGLGLNLQEASYVFHLDRWWNPAVERQAEDRTHRIGQTEKVNVIKYSCTGTIEERIDGILEQKQSLFDHLIDDVSVDLSAHLTGAELFGLFGLPPAAPP